MSFAQFRSALKWLALILLLSGLGSAALIWHAQDRIDRQNEAVEIASNPAAPLAPLDSRRAVRDAQINYGQSALVLERAEGLLHGKALANTIAIISVLIAAGLFLTAARLE